MKTRFCSAIQPQLLMMMAAKLSMRSFSTSQNSESRYPSGSSDIFKRAIRRKTAMCVVRDGVLYVQKKKKNDHVSV